MLEYPLMRPVIPMATVALYCSSVLIALALAPRDVKKAAPAAAGKASGPKFGWLTILTSLHNAAMCALSAWMCYETVAGTADAYGWLEPGVPKALWCLPVEKHGAPYSRNAARVAFITWVFCASKYAELIDTLIMFIKGNYRQVCGRQWPGTCRLGNTLRWAAGVLLARLSPRGHDLPDRPDQRHLLLHCEWGESASYLSAHAE